MLTFTEKESLMRHLKNLKNQQVSIGFVPTMGALHNGHLSLVQKSVADNDITVVSIFVNPTQFDNPSDLEKYPRDLEKDISLLEPFNSKLIVFTPSISNMYENGLTSDTYFFDNLENEMEGKHRKGHFDGVATVVSKLFEIINPNKAYFGEKDFQQLQIIRKMVAQNGQKVSIVNCPIVREDNGLAMSSRNERLSTKEREEAAIIYQTLKEVKEKFHSENIETLNKLVTERFLPYANMQLEYFEIADEETLKSANSKEANKKYRAFIAVFIGGVRLIDNIALY
ncbi:MAG: pantoate--beta-alanine ligase [Bacteroidetes bacterium]|jgi:pantoate--beta-alanine ligase|nr:pantoate--beta-alanine ligase [Bacteroidota bacterium]